MTTTLGDLEIPGVEPGSVYVLRSTIGPDRLGDRRDLLHVISRHRGGEIRGFERDVSSRGPWVQRTPDYLGSWPEVDQALSNLLREAVRDSKGNEYGPTDFQSTEKSRAVPAHATAGRSALVGGERQPLLPGVTA